ncbi:hypothetical protein B7R77_03060 [Ralstonia solanacearum K60]|uniref:DUF1320 domain-containing protein n=1 Tax=Ralstonia solanacearum K60 TaxID=1091042 RepID=A0AAP8D348_RALSL|nr:DUF1320 domain-containing protein [Ralstonia solanacearum]OYQ12334.1 hypothetical protein B7R77_03060 [Ralstonia solanacearum K60]CCF96534.1 putative phage protein [Ralstonia solanacearum K60]
MPYATVEDMTLAFGEREMLALTDRTVQGVIDAVLAASKLAEAEAEIKGYLARRYALPLLAVDPMLKTTACEIARYRLTGAETTETQPVRDRYRDALRWLERVATGEVLLVDQLGRALGDPGQSGMGSVKTVPGRRVFDDGSLADYRFYGS